MAAPLNLIAVPLLAGLAAGGAALANRASGPAAAPVEIAKPVDRPCEAQTWPYLEAKCLAQASNRRVRLVMAPRTETTDAAEDTAPGTTPAPAAAAPDQPGLTSSSAVLYHPQAPAPGTKAHRKRPERTARRSARLSQVSSESARLYQVPSESRSGSGAMIVVHPLGHDIVR